jgi:DNA replication protein DnaC
VTAPLQDLDLFREHGLTGWLAEASLWSFLPRADWPKSLRVQEVVSEYAYAVLDGREHGWMILTGEYGGGKTHLAAGVVKELLLAGQEAFFISWLEFLEDMKGGNWDHPWLRRMKGAALIAIDDVDKYRPTDWSRGMMYRLLNRCYVNRQPVILTLNAPLDAPTTVEMLGQAVVSRALEVATHVITFDGPDWRALSPQARVRAMAVA